ncbi:MAG: hypothetical protein IPM99_12820 [Rubrivivax sp.]|nr:hypothetical protein [Rubrivivax sp.]
MQRQVQQLVWTYGGLIAFVLAAGIGWQAWRTRREAPPPSTPSGAPA